MTNDSAYIVDPYLLQRPSPGEWLAAVDSILSWTAYGSGHTRQFILSSACVSCLMEPGNCPYLNAFDLHRMLRAEGELSIAAHDLQSQVNRLLTDAECSEAAASTQRLELKPEVVLTRQCAQQIKDGFPRCLIALHLARSPETDNRSVPTASRPGDGLYAETQVQVAARVCDVRGVHQHKLNLPLDVSFSFRLLFKPPTTPVDPTDLIVDPVSALTKAYEVQVPEADKDLYPLRDFSVGSEFVPSLLRLHLESQPRVLRSIVRDAVRILSGQGERFPAMAIHPQRVGPGPSDPPRVRSDGAQAYRVHLTKHGAGYRLLYWQKGSTYELWEVRTESD